MTPSTQPGLLGICLSGAGPTILALATEKFTEIAERIIANFASNNISCQWKLLEPAQDGAMVQY
jgi:homoserine kinase